MRALLPISVVLSVLVAAGAWWLATRTESAAPRSRTANREVPPTAPGDDEGGTLRASESTEAKPAASEWSLEALLASEGAHPFEQDEFVRRLAKAAKDRADGVPLLNGALRKAWRTDDRDNIEPIALALGLLRSPPALRALQGFIDELRADDIVPPDYLVEAVVGSGPGLEPELRDWLFELLKEGVARTIQHRTPPKEGESSIGLGAATRDEDDPIEIGFDPSSWSAAAEALVRGDVPLAELKRYLDFMRTIDDEEIREELRKGLSRSRGPEASDWAAEILRTRRWKDRLELEAAVRVAARALRPEGADTIRFVLDHSDSNGERHAVLDALADPPLDPRHLRRFFPSVKRIALDPRNGVLEAKALAYYTFLALERNHDPRGALGIVRATVRSGVDAPREAVRGLRKEDLPAVQELILEHAKGAEKLVRLFPRSSTKYLRTRDIRKLMTFVAQHRSAHPRARAAARRWLTWMDELRALGTD